MDVLVVNAGSSSLKLTVLGPDDTVLAEHHVERWDGRPDLGHLPLPRVDAVGHRVVHGGTRFTEPTVLDDRVRRGIEELTDLAPLHQPRALAGIDAAVGLFPDVPHVACFDTAFHRTLPPVAATYPLPAQWRERWDLHRYGFHGLSHAHASRHAVDLAGGGSRVVTCHLGAGCSLAAVRDGRSVDTTMGFTPMAGLPMATRPGDLDPGLLLWLLDHLTPGELADGLAHRSGLAGLAGHADLRDVHRAAADGDPAARLAVDVFAHRLRQGVAAMAASMGGLDLLVFTGGVGEHDAEVRARVVDGLAFLGPTLDRDANLTASGDSRISAAGSAIGVWVVTAREDAEVAAGTRTALLRTPLARAGARADARRAEPPPPS
ncbi:acetate/propionate family kinase [Saccharothrix syringae]|uniref:Acetate kinase n=1 Tax=Saccharothrix syringae TaxID=103733 RepID=A0A5Q0H294_SACSY|nr:acetate/propionate family kinase [Saccharothrix syringae]QFZ20233.1 acetate/propionate family kinase [Saccharothrix syringae]